MIFSFVWFFKSDETIITVGLLYCCKLHQYKIQVKGINLKTKKICRLKNYNRLQDEVMSGLKG
jgi:hypothetical protein